MARTLVAAEDSAVLSKHLHQQYRSGDYTYTLSRERGHATMQVMGDGQKRTANLQWAFGSGEVGQSYLWKEADGGYREARFNYFATLDGFAATPGRLHGAPASIDMALGRRVEPFEARTCFACHTTAISAAPSPSAKSFVPGVTCEACHGPGAQHVAAMQSGESGDPRIVNPAHMRPDESVDFCGACHSAPWDVRMMGAVGLQTVRFPAYRLEKSRCWGTAGDPRVTCFACHDPHKPLEQQAAAYDSACLKCHTVRGHAVDAQHPGAACTVASTRCATCHMQKFQLPEMHAKFTDHWIRIVREGEAFPD